MTPDGLTDLTQHIGAGPDVPSDRDEPSMRWLELGLAITAITVVVLLAVLQAQAV